MSVSVHVIDAFASAAYRGNPAAVCLLDAFLPEALMQNIAMEMNLAETAFLVKRANLTYDLRWFTPEVEVTLCGHATLATAHFLKETGDAKEGDIITFYTKSGELTAHLHKDKIELDFPSLPGKDITPPAIMKALGVEIKNCQKSRDNYLVEVADYEALLACSPDFGALAALDMLGVIVTAAGGPEGVDFTSRYFAPGAGINEDPVTGSAHCVLAPYWAAKLGKKSFSAIQASKRRGELQVTLAGDRVRMQGRAFTTLKGILELPAASAKEKAA